MNRLFWLTLIFLLCSWGGIIQAQSAPITNTVSSPHQAEWVYGYVTKRPHKINSKIYIAVDGNLYSIEDDCTLALREEKDGRFEEEDLSMRQIRDKQEIALLVRGNSAIQLLIFYR